MQVPFLDLRAINEPIRSELEAVYAQVLDESHFIYGRQVSGFESAFADKCGVKHCIATGNCTDALYITLSMLGIKPGDEVLIPAMTWITDAEVVTQLGATPVFIDVDEHSFTIDTSKIESSITDKTRAIIPVHLYGRICDMPAIISIAEKHDLMVVEDCAQSHFASVKGKVAGSFGRAGVFSFYPTKNLGALGDAGCIITNDDELALACRKFANHGATDKNSHEFPGINSRMDTLQAAILNVKLEHIDRWNDERNRLASVYTHALSEIEELTLPSAFPEGAHVFHIYAIATKRRDKLKVFLKEEGVLSEIHYPKAVPFTRAYAHMNFRSGDFPVSYLLQNEQLSLPLYPGMTEEMQSHVIKTIKSFFKA